MLQRWQVLSTMNGLKHHIITRNIIEEQNESKHVFGHRIHCVGLFPEIRDLFTDKSRKLLFLDPACQELPAFTITIPSQQHAKPYDSFYRG